MLWVWQNADWLRNVSTHLWLGAYKYTLNRMKIHELDPTKQQICIVSGWPSRCVHKSQRDWAARPSQIPWPLCPAFYILTVTWHCATPSKGTTKDYAEILTPWKRRKLSLFFPNATFFPSATRWHHRMSNDGDLLKGTLKPQEKQSQIFMFSVNWQEMFNLTQKEG